MSIIDRSPGTTEVDDLELLASLEPAGPERTPSPPEAFPLSGPGKVLLATLSMAVGAIHLVMVPSHAAEWLPEGIAFAAAGWLQIVLGILIVTRPSRWVVRVSCLANAAFILAWVVTRVSGMPFGPEAGHVHAATFVDVTCVALEALLVLAGYELLARPERGANLKPPALVVLSAVPVAAIVLATAAISSPSAANHGHSESASGAAAGDHDHGDSGVTTTGSGGTAAGDHAHADAGAAPADDKGLSLVMNGQGEGGGHSHNDTQVKLDAATQAQLDGQLALTKPLIEKYPTVAAAEADGYFRSGPFVPGLGTHYTSARINGNIDGKMDPDDMDRPTLIYDGLNPDSKLAGFMYLSFSPDRNVAPEGFAGTNDHWHFHTNVCIVARPGGGIDAPLGADTTTTQDVCDKYGGKVIEYTGYMVHVWTVPGYDSPQGLFSNTNSRITCADGTYYIYPPEEIGTKASACKDGSNGLGHPA